MRLAVYGKAQVVAGGGSIKDVAPGLRVVGRHLHGPLHHAAGMVFPVRLVKGRIARNDFLFDKARKERVHAQKLRSQQRKELLVGREPADLPKLGIVQPAGGFVLV